MDNETFNVLVGFTERDAEWQRSLDRLAEKLVALSTPEPQWHDEQEWAGL